MALGFALFAGTSAEIIRASAREAEQLGYSSFWVNHPGPTDGLASLAHAAGDTKRIALGIGVIPLHTRGPESIVQGVRGHKLPLDRLLLGVGSPNPHSLGRVRDGAAAAGRKAPTLYAYVRLALGAKGGEKLAEEGGRYAAIPAYGAHFDRMGMKPIETCIAAHNPAEVTMGLGKWKGAVDEVVLRAITGEDTVEENLKLLHAAKPS